MDHSGPAKSTRSSMTPKRPDILDPKVLQENGKVMNAGALTKPHGLDFKSERTREEHIKYFRNLVADETFYEETLANQWEQKLKNFGPESPNPTITEEGADCIRLAIGQSRLFLKKKMQQFVGLVDECERGVTTTSPTDLAGFWEMIYMQVKNIHDKFDNLASLSKNNWQTPQKSKSNVDGAKRNGTKKVANGKPKAAASTSSVQASSKIREAIEKARAAKSGQSDVAPEAVPNA